MNRMLRPPSTLLIALALSLLAARAQAALGGNYQSVQADSALVKAQLRSTATTQYTVHEFTTAANATIREYATPSGTVFAVTWQSFSMPDLRELLGTHFGQYRAAATAASQPGAHRHLRISEPNLVVESSGRMRDFHGRAYVPGLVPSGVVVDQLR